MRYAYYPGCYAKGTAAELDLSTRAVCTRLGIELEEMSAAPCCGAGDVQQVDGPLAAGLNALTLAQAERLGLDVLTICNVCTLSLRQANAALHASAEASDEGCLAVADPAASSAAVPPTSAASPGTPVRVAPPASTVPPSGEDTGGAAVPGAAVPGVRATHPAPGHAWPVSPRDAAAQARAALAAEGMTYGGGVRVTHLLWALWKDYGAAQLSERVSHRLSGLTLAPFYGCQILRPASLNEDDAPDDPTALEDVLEACGARSVDYDGRLKCCGWPLMYVRQRAAGVMAARAVRNAVAAGADALVTPCPLCHAALEGCQASGCDLVGESLDLPVLHLAQVVGLALGCTAEELRLTHHLIDAKPVLARAGLALS